MNQKKLRRSRHDKIFAGVCGGIAEYFGLSSTAIRLLYILLPPGIFLYIILAMIIPEE